MNQDGFKSQIITVIAALMLTLALLLSGCTHYRTYSQRYCDMAKQWQFDIKAPHTPEEWRQIEYYEYGVCTGGLSDDE